MRLSMVTTGALGSKILISLCIVALFLASPSNSRGGEVPEMTLSLDKCITIALSNTTS